MLCDLGSCTPAETTRARLGPPASVAVRTQRGPSTALGSGFGRRYVSAGTATSQNSVKPLSSSGWGPETDSMVWEMNSSSSVSVGVPL